MNDSSVTASDVSLLEHATPYQRALLADLRSRIATESLHLSASGHGAFVCALVCDGSVAVGRIDPRKVATVVSLETARDLLEGYDEYLEALSQPCPVGYIRVLCATLGDCVVLTMGITAWPVIAAVGQA